MHNSILGMYFVGPFILFHTLIFFNIVQNNNVTSSPYPYLTECFRNTVLQWVPICIFWLIVPLSLYMLLKRQIQLQPLAVSTLFVIKMVNIYAFVFERDMQKL
jgi:hypothetical protein